MMSLKMIVRVGLAPTLFLMWRLYRPLRSLLSHLTLLVTVTGLEPASHALKVRCKTILLHRDLKWYLLRELNPRLTD